MYGFKDISGRKFGMLTVIHRASNRGAIVHWKCVCECGGEKIASGHNLKSGNTKSCGCIRKQPRVHGLRYHPLYAAWKSMITRCKNTNHPSYKDYGGRGIKVCDNWLTTANFIAWGEGSGYEKGLEIDRIDNNGDYCPENCRFVTPKENANNSRLLTARNTSGYRGVSFSKHRKKYRAQIGGNDEVFNGKSNKCLGLFNTPEEAAEARDRFIIENNLPYRKLQILKRP